METFALLFLLFLQSLAVYVYLSYDASSSDINSNFDTRILTRHHDQEWSSKSRKITNDVQWRDDHGNILETGDGGKISIIDGVWYWVGCEPNTLKNKTKGGDIFLYKSNNVGSNSWEYLSKAYEFPKNETKGRGKNCQLEKHPIYGTHHIFCKGFKFYINSNDLLESNVKFNKLPKPDDPSNLTDWGHGGTSIFREGTDDMYIIVSRCDKSTGKCINTSRSLFIYKLNETWNGFATFNPIVTQWIWPHREAPQIIKRNDFYYLIASETKGWKQSRTWYKRSKTLLGLANSTEAEMIMHPESPNRPRYKSMGSQFRFLFKAGQGKWLFSGSRYPDEDPIDYDAKYGRHVIASRVLIGMNIIIHLVTSMNFFIQ
mmetsp:Transcript_21632/g.26552  ORF Transcript_21632/g.26552 Transcript_21632/m.26552 type:complete len:372 (-) Transcript_21632:183-1298(-)